MDRLSPLVVHTLFDVLAWLTAGAVAVTVTRWRPHAFPPVAARGQYYLPVLLISAAAGAYALGTANLWLSGQSGVARSIEGALLGGVIGVELYKWFNGVSGRTGAKLAAPLAAGIAVGRIGCFLAGLDDFTYGAPTGVAWAVDFGDGITRHPVQLYESLALAIFLLAYLVALARKSSFVGANGFSLMIGFYGIQRFGWEFLKPYGTLLGPLTLFHLTSTLLIAYAAALLCGSAHSVASGTAKI